MSPRPAASPIAASLTVPRNDETASVRMPAATTHARDVRVTWWYTAGSLVVFQLTTLFMWLLALLYREPPLPYPAALTLFVAGAAVSVAAGVLLLVRYRVEPVDDAEDHRAGVPWVLLGASAAAALALGAGLGSPLLAVTTAAYALCLVRWQGGIRFRLVLLLTVVILAVWFVEGTRLNPDAYAGPVTSAAVFGALLVPITASSLWWWDVVRELDRARRAEGRLAAAQERLRLASDLHDLQGHHLQVIALQLELAEKMLARDPDAAADQVRAARVSVDEARRGTRDLAARFRGVPLPDELANAVDLLRAAGLRVRLDVAEDAAEAPADVLGPVVRECTTNVLKHGGGAEASLSLLRRDGAWVLSIGNDVRGETSPVGDGAGLAGIAARVGAIGGTMDAAASGDHFVVTVAVPAGVVS
ncbi:sensor histidine kinase [Microbacterium enclense]|uniref:sensor histidine kinase n=1 Tax=Microbacterium enclense TaxID=993073 RepID=UPI0036DB9BB4